MRGENGELTYVRRRVGPGDDFCPTPKWSRWPRDWRGRAASIRRATPTEVVLWEAAQEQVEELRPLTKSALRDLIRGHEQGTLA